MITTISLLIAAILCTAEDSPLPIIAVLVAAILFNVFR
jgi:hypothetical protein